MQLRDLFRHISYAETQIIEHDIPLFSENLDHEINTVIQELINDYRQG